MFLSVLSNKRHIVTMLVITILNLWTSGCSMLMGTITTEPPRFPPEIVNVKLASEHVAYGLTRIAVSIDFRDLDGDVQKNEALVEYVVEQVWNTGDYCWILDNPRAPLQRKPIEGKIKPDEVTLGASGDKGTAIIRVGVAIWPESAFCTAGVRVRIIDKAGNLSNWSDRQTIRLFEGYH